MNINIKHKNKCGIYCIKNIVNNKVYIGKSKNIYKRMHQHLYDLKNNRTENENSHMIASWNKYGAENFEYYILEYLPLDDDVVRVRELFWVKKFKSTNRKFGYNFRTDSSTNMITHAETSKKISDRLKKEWATGIRGGHSEKLKSNWNKNINRKLEQSKSFSRVKTKYRYLINIGDEIRIFDYKQLLELGLANCLSNFHRLKSNTCKHKGVEIVRELV